MADLLPMPSSEHFAALAHATFVARRVPHSRFKLATVSGHAQKAVLLAIAASRGRPITHRRLGRVAGCCHRGAMRAVVALLEQGVVERRLPLAGGRRAGAYVVNWDRVVAAVDADVLRDLSVVLPGFQLRRAS